MTIEHRLISWFGEGLATAAPGLGIDGDLPTPELLAPKQKDHGDFATNVALALAKRAGAPPRDVAQAIADALPRVPFVEKVEVAGPGFLNVFTTDTWLHDTLRRIVADGDGVRPRGADRREGPGGIREREPDRSAHPRPRAQRRDRRCRCPPVRGLRVTRSSASTTSTTRAGRWTGSVASVEARYLQLVGREAQVPDDGYHGDYIAGLAEDILSDEGAGLADLPDPDRLVRIREEAVRRVLGWIEATLERFGVRFDVFFSEAELARKGEIDAAVERLRDAGKVYDAEGAVWFRSTEYGDDKDRVVIRSNGRHTYFAADCAYVIDKFSRGFDHLVYVWGADHHGDVARVKGAAQALGYDPGAVEMLIYQWVSFLRDGEPVAMGKRSGNFITLDELLDEVGRRRDPVPPVALRQRRRAELRHRGGEATLDGQPGLLRAVRARTDRVAAPQGRRPGRRARARRGRRSHRADARGRAPAAAWARRCSRRRSRWRPTCVLPIA